MVSMTANSFVAQIGGQVSLWIGGSIISVFQLLIYLIRYCCVCTKRRIEQRRTKQSESTEAPSKRPKKIEKRKEERDNFHNEAEGARYSLIRSQDGEWKTKYNF